MSLGVLVTVNAPAKQSARSSIGCPLDPGDWPELERPGGDLERWQYKEVLSDDDDAMLTSPWPWEETSAPRASG